MNNFYYQREGESVQEAFARWHNEQAQKFREERKREQREKEMEDRVFKRVYDQVMKNLTVEVKNQASPALKELKKDIDNLFKR